MSRILGFVIAILLIIAGVGACADLELMGTGDTRHYIFFCTVSDTLHVGVDSMTVVCSDSTGAVGLSAELEGE
jgi:hypothetical protein